MSGAPKDALIAAPVTAILEELRDVVRMTETATFRVLDETEALVNDARAAARLLADLQGHGGVGEPTGGPARALAELVERSNARAMEIMSALEFQDLTSQKVMRTFAVLEDVAERLAGIQRRLEEA